MTAAADEARARIAQGATVILDGVEDGPHVICPCERCTLMHELGEAGYWRAPGQIWVPPGGSFGAGPL